jgi:hypothetical protein
MVEDCSLVAFVMILLTFEPSKRVHASFRVRNLVSVKKLMQEDAATIGGSRLMSTENLLGCWFAKEIKLDSRDPSYFLFYKRGST